MLAIAISSRLGRTGLVLALDGAVAAFALDCHKLFATKPQYKPTIGRDRLGLGSALLKASVL